MAPCGQRCLVMASATQDESAGFGTVRWSEELGRNVPIPVKSGLAASPSLRSTVAALAAGALCSACGTGAPPAQLADLLVTNAHVVTGTGVTLDGASVVVMGGRITAVTNGPARVQAVRTVDATGFTVMPGLIDTHRHLFIGERGASATGRLVFPAPPLLISQEAVDTWRERQLPDALSGLLAAGLTTVLVPGDYMPEIVDLRRRIKDGELVGPRLLTTGWIFTAPGDHPATTVCQKDSFCRARSTVEANDPDQARAKVRELAAAGVDGIKAVIDRLAVPDTTLAADVLAAIADESSRLGLPLLVHAVTVDDMMRAVDAGADRLVHTPHTGSLAATDAAGRIRSAGIAVATTVSFSSEAFDQVIGVARSAPADARHRQLLANVRHLWDEGVTVAFGTDSPPGLDFMAEVRALHAVLSPEEIVTSLTRNAAAFLHREEDLGTLEPGKIADLVVVDGDPLSRIEDLARVVMVVKDGAVVVDRR